MSYEYSEYMHRLEFESDPKNWPLSDEQITVLDTFQEKYHALCTCNEKKGRCTLHFFLPDEMTPEEILRDLPGFRIRDFYEVTMN
jgi:hypothetical protein